MQVYRADRDYTANVDDVAAERFFYSELAVDGQTTLDDLITDYENQLTDDIAELNASCPGTADPCVAARVVTHLLVRNDHVRGMMRSGVAAIADTVVSLFGSDEKIRAVMGVEGTRAGPRFRALFAEHIASHPLFEMLALPEPAAQRLAYLFVRESSHGGWNEMSEAVSPMVDRLSTDGPAVARDAHVRTLEESLVPAVRTAFLETFAWSVQEVQDGLFILPDYVALAISKDGEAGSLLMVDNEDTVAVLMPLAPNRMLVGRTGDPHVSLENFNSLAAPLCLDFFVSAGTEPEFRSLADSIGSAVNARLHETMAGAASEFRTQLDEPINEPDEDAPAWRAAPLKPAELHTDCFAPEDARRLATLLGHLVRVAHERFDVRGLWSVHIAADYEAALAGVDRGGLADAEPPPTASSDGWSVAYNVPVERDGEIGIAVVLRSEIGDGLLDDDTEHFGAAASIVLAQLARVGADALLADVFREGVKSGDAVDELLTRHAAPAWKSWQVAGYSSMFTAALRDHCGDTLIEQLENLRASLEPIRRAYRLHGDVDRLLNEALPLVAAVLSTAAAAAAASCKSRDPEDPAELAFQRALIRLDIKRWFDLLCSDLVAIWHEGTAYPPQERLLVLNRHLERLLLFGAIFLWDDDGDGRVEVPFWSDWNWLQSELANKARSDPERPE